MPRVCRLCKTGQLIQGTLAGIVVDYLPRLYEAEQYITQRLLAAAARDYPEPGNLKALLKAAERDSGLQ